MFLHSLQIMRHDIVFRRVTAQSRIRSCSVYDSFRSSFHSLSWLLGRNFNLYVTVRCPEIDLFSRHKKSNYAKFLCLLMCSLWNSTESIIADCKQQIKSLLARPTQIRNKPPPHTYQSGSHFHRRKFKTPGTILLDLKEHHWQICRTRPRKCEFKYIPLKDTYMYHGYPCTMLTFSSKFFSLKSRCTFYPIRNLFIWGNLVICTGARKNTKSDNSKFYEGEINQDKKFV